MLYLYAFFVSSRRTPADGEETKKKRDKEEKKVKKARPQKIESGSDDEDMAGGGWEQVQGGVNVAVVSDNYHSFLLNCQRSNVFLCQTFSMFNSFLILSEF